MEKKLIGLLEDIGQSFFRSGNDLKDSRLLDSIKSISANIAELNKNCSKYIKLTDENSEYKEKEDKIVSELNSINTKFNTLYQKVGVELYGTISLDDIENLDIKKLYEMIVHGEKESETLERDIYKLENSVFKKNLLNNVVNPLKLSRIKNRLQLKNKKNLRAIAELGKLYCNTKDRNSIKVSVNELYNEYESLQEKFKNKKSSLDLIKEKIDETSKEIISLGSKSRIENEVKQLESKLNNEFLRLGKEVCNDNELSLSRDIEVKVNNYKSSKIKIELKQYNEDLVKKRDYVNKLLLKIHKKRDELKILEEENTELEIKIKELEEKIKESQSALEDIVLE